MPHLVLSPLLALQVSATGTDVALVCDNISLSQRLALGSASATISLTGDIIATGNVLDSAKLLPAKGVPTALAA
jgi:hypothetical protein